jgi:hypothetical protein
MYIYVHTHTQSHTHSHSHTSVYKNNLYKLHECIDPVLNVVILQELLWTERTVVINRSYQ